MQDRQMTERSKSNKVEMFVFQLAMFTALILAFVVQVQVIFPFERTFVPDKIVEVVSLLFLPFGLKIIFAALVGSQALVPIFLSHAIGRIYFGEGMGEAFFTALVAVAVLYLPIIILNFVRERSSMATIDLAENNVSIFRYILALAFSASVLNAFFHTMIYQDLNIDLLAFRFVVGDLGGTIVVLMCILLAKQPIVRFMYKLQGNK